MTFDEFKSVWDEAVEKDLANIKHTVMQQDSSMGVDNHNCEVMFIFKDLLRDVPVDRVGKRCFGICPFYESNLDGKCFVELGILDNFYINQENIVRQYAQYIKVEKRMGEYDCTELYDRYKEYLAKDADNDI